MHWTAVLISKRSQKQYNEMLNYFSVLYYVKMKEQNGINNCL